MSKAPLRVCFVIQKLLGLSGGAERVFLQTVVAMAARGMQVEILIYDTSNGTPQFETAGVPITNLLPWFLKKPTKAGPRGNRTPKSLKRLPHGGVVGHLKWAITHGLFIRCLKTALKKRHPDVVVAFLPPAITTTVIAGRTLDIPVIASTHNVPEQDFGADSPRWDQNPLYRRRARTALSEATRITILQESFRGWFRPEEQDRIDVIANAISRLSSKDTSRPEREKLILGVGRLTSVKRFDLLIAAWEKIHLKFPGWRVEIYGEGPDQQALTDQISAAGLHDSIKLRGVSSDLGAIYDSASLLCHPATFEGFGLVVGEAMSHGTPAIGFSDCTGINQLITHGVDGILINPDPDRVNALARELENALNQPDHLRALGAAAEQITQTYSPEAVANQWENVIRKAAAKT